MTAIAKLFDANKEFLEDKLLKSNIELDNAKKDLESVSNANNPKEFLNYNFNYDQHKTRVKQLEDEIRVISDAILLNDYLKSKAIENTNKIMEDLRTIKPMPKDNIPQ